MSEAIQCECVDPDCIRAHEDEVSEDYYFCDDCAAELKGLDFVHGLCLECRAGAEEQD